MKKLWEVSYKQNKIVEEYCFGKEGALDTRLIPFDVLGSIAHAKMLAIISVLTKQEYKKLKSSLLNILKLFDQGKFIVESGDEDVHTKIEAYLIEQLGGLGKKIHTGRSRNDQVLVDLRLFAKESLFTSAEVSMDLIRVFLDFAKQHEFVAMPGYTHMQRAMPSSVGLWAASFVESLLDDILLLKSAYELNNQSPLGSGASYGVPLNIDREFVAKTLGFAKVQNNVLYTQASRGKVQLVGMHALTQIMLTLSRFAQDLLLFTTSEFNFFTLPEEFSTGSSIMPQKKNFDVMEILRAKTHVVVNQEHVVAEIIAGLPSGYNADFGLTKEPFMEAFDTVIESLKVVELVVKALKPNVEVMKKACTPELFATYEAYFLVKKGTPFREAHHIIARSLSNVSSFEVEEVLKETNHTGGPGNLGLVGLEKNIDKKNKWWQGERERYKEVIDALRRG